MELQEWLDNPADFEIGKKLYNTYSIRYRPNKILARQINGFQNSVTHRLLIDELTAIAASIPQRKTASAKYHTVGKDVDLPDDLKKLSEEIPVLYKNRDFLRYKARDMEPGSALRQMARQIVELDLKIRKRYKVLDFYARTGNYPPGFHNPDEHEQSEREKLIFWLKAMRSYPSWISRNKNNPLRADEVAEKRKVMQDIDEFLRNADKEE